MSAAASSFEGLNSEIVKPSSHDSRPQEKQCRRARLVFQVVISTRSEPHWQNSNTATGHELTWQANKGEMRSPLPERREELGEHHAKAAASGAVTVIPIPLLALEAADVVAGAPARRAFL